MSDSDEHDGNVQEVGTFSYMYYGHGGMRTLTTVYGKHVGLVASALSRDRVDLAFVCVFVCRINFDSLINLIISN